MVMKIIDTNLDMYGNTVQNICIETVTEIPVSIDVGRIVYLSPAKEIYVCTEDGWKTAGQVNPFENIKVNGEVVAPVDGAVNIIVPTRTSHLVNDSGYITKGVTTLDHFYPKEELYTREELDSKLQAITQFDFKVVDALPEIGEWGYIYLVPSPSSKSKNVKDEYIWVDDAWEQIGSTQFKLDLVQTADGITVNNTALQKATAEQDGLMTKEMVSEFRAKQDKLTAGANIVIDGGVISAVGGGTGGGHPTVIREFGGDGALEYLIEHDLNSYNLLFQVRTVSAPIRYVQTGLEAVDANTIKVILAEPLNDRLSISILACDRAATPTEFNVETKEITTPMTIWSLNNPTGNAVFCQLFDDTGDELRGDIVQESAEGFTPVVASFDTAYSGTMLVAKATKVFDFEKKTGMTIDLVQEGFSTDDKFLIQIFTDEMGQTMADIIQDSGSGVIEIDFGGMSLTGFVILRSASVVQTFENASEVVCQHDLGRKVGVQVYLEGSGQALADVKCTSENVVTVSMGSEVTGYVVVL